jgi:hypothetical protein
MGRACTMHWTEDICVYGLGRDHLEHLQADRRKILKLIFKKLDEMVWIRFIWLRMGTSGRFL